jgi:hypothetical protein
LYFVFVVILLVFKYGTKSVHDGYRAEHCRNTANCRLWGPDMQYEGK